MLWLKLFSIIKIRPWHHTRYGIGYPTYQNVTIGGQTPEGQDATNDISYMVLDTIRETRLTQPNVSARIHAGTPDRFLFECARTIRLGMGMPAIKNDEIIVPALLEKGVRSEDAYDYAIVGCIEAAVPGKWGYRNTGMSFLNLLKVLELTLNDGTDPATGIQLLPGRGDLTAFDSIESLYAAYREQLRFYTRLSIEADTVADLCLEDMAPDAFCSALVDDCIARGKTIKEGGAVYDIISGLQSGVSNVADAFMALKTRVFEEKALTAAQVKESLAADFQNPGGEMVRQRLLHAPKYGNDIAEVDGIAARVLNDYLDEVAPLSQHAPRPWAYRRRLCGIDLEHLGERAVRGQCRRDSRWAPCGRADCGRRVARPRLRHRRPHQGAPFAFPIAHNQEHRPIAEPAFVARKPGI